MRIGVAATPGVSIPTLDWLLSSTHELELVITQPDKPAGRGRTLKSSVVAQWALSRGIDCVKPVTSADLRESLGPLDLVVTIGYGVILPLEILSIPRYGFVNLHFSLLPAWRGAAPVQRSIQHGDERTGMTVFALDAGMDTGPIYSQRDVNIQPYENAGELLSRMSILGPELVAQTLKMIESGQIPRPQGDEGVSYAPKISKGDARISWGESAKEIDRHIRAFTPEPGAWTMWRESILRIDRTRPFYVNQKITPGEIVLDGNHLMVGTAGDHALILEEVTPAGKKCMSAKSWANGARISKGMSFV